MQTGDRALQKFVFRKKPKQPFRLDFTAWALRRLPQNMIDRFQDQEYRRVLIFENRLVEVSVSQPGLKEPLRVCVTGENILSNHVELTITVLLDRILGLGTDLAHFYRLFGADSKIGNLIEEFKGVKPPRFPTVFEALVNAFACQQVSLNVGLLLLNRLAVNYGSTMLVEGKRVYGFPDPQRLAELDVQDLRKVGFSSRKAEYIIETAKLVSKQKIDPESIAEMDQSEAIEFLRQIRGIGPWTAQYALLRGAGRLDVFPANDVGGQNGLRNLLGLRRKLDSDAVNRLISKWEPYAGMLYFHLLLRKIQKKGYMNQ